MTQNNAYIKNAIQLRIVSTFSFQQDNISCLYVKNHLKTYDKLNLHSEKPNIFMPQWKCLFQKCFILRNSNALFILTEHPLGAVLL